MDATEFFEHPQAAAHKQYEALRAFYVENKSAAEVAQQFGYTLSSFYSLTRDFNRQLKHPHPSQHFFVRPSRRRKPKASTDSTQQLIIDLRTKYLSVPDIKVMLDAMGHSVSERHIYDILEQAGFSRLPRRSKQQHREAIANVQLSAPATEMLTYTQETFSSRQGIGLLCLLPDRVSQGVWQKYSTSGYHRQWQD